MVERVSKTTRFKTEAARRRADLERARQRRQPRKPTPVEVAKVRRRVVCRYRHLKVVLPTEQEAAEQAAREHQTSPSTLRRWDYLYRHGGLKALIPQSKRPKTIRRQIPLGADTLISQGNLIGEVDKDGNLVFDWLKKGVKGVRQNDKKTVRLRRPRRSRVTLMLRPPWKRSKPTLSKRWMRS